jgi:hypothetical protein
MQNSHHTLKCAKPTSPKPERDAPRGVLTNRSQNETSKDHHTIFFFICTTKSPNLTKFWSRKKNPQETQRQQRQISKHHHIANSSRKKNQNNTTKNFRNHTISASNHQHPTIIDITNSNAQVVKTLKRLTLISLASQNERKTQQPNNPTKPLSLSLSLSLS